MLEPGIYFGLAAADYHGDPALGSTNLKRLLASGPDYWWDSAMNPARPEGNEDTPALLFGRAVHTMVLDGVDAFDAQYMQEPEPEGLLVTVADLDEFMAARFMEGASPDLARAAPNPRANKAAKVAFIQQHWPEARILDVIRADAAAEGKVILAQDDYARIVTAGSMVAGNPALAQAFQGGYPEVSVFWNKQLPDGSVIRCKCRFDYLKVRAITDLKSIRNVKGRSFPRACREAIANLGYDTQAAHYMEGRAQLPAFVAEGRVFGAHDPEWLARVAESEECAFVFVFYQAAGAPITWGTQLSPGNPILEYGRSNADLALHTFQQFSKRFQPGEAWVLEEPISELAMEEMPGWYGR